MQNEIARLSTMPSALVLSDLLAGHADNPPREALERAGFSRNQIDGYLKQRESRSSSCNSRTRGK